MGGGRKKLIAVARLYCGDPTKYGRSCQDCKRWVYDADTGRRALDKTKRLPDGGQDPGAFLPMPKTSDPPCHTCAKTVGMEPSRRHWRFGPPDPPEWCYRAFKFFLRCRAVNWQTPHAGDPVVMRNAELFQGVLEAHERGQHLGMLTALGLLKRT